MVQKFNAFNIFVIFIFLHHFVDLCHFVVIRSFHDFTNCSPFQILTFITMLLI